MDTASIKRIQAALGVEQDGIIGPITRKAYADRLISIGREEIGFSEVGTSNSGKRVKEYQACTDLGGTGWPWCAAFICFLFKLSGIFNEEDRPKTAAAFGFEEWGRRIGMRVIKSPKSILMGDICIWRFSHISIATSDSNGSGNFTSLEGNTNEAGSREGGKVLEKSRERARVRSVLRI